MMTTQPIEPTEQSFLQQHWQKLAALAFWVTLLGSGFAYAYINNLTATDLLLQIIELMQTPIGPLIYIFVYAIRPLTFLSAAALTLAAGSIFGAGGPLNLALAVFYTLIASHVSATVAYVVGRYFGEGLIPEGDAESGGWVQQWSTRLRENTFITVVTMRALFLPFDLVSYLAGFLKVSWLSFISASILGSIAGSIAFVSFGASLSIEQIIAGETPEFDVTVFAFGLALVIITIGVSQYLKKREAAQKME